VDDVRIGRVIRALRHQLAWRQADLAAAGRVSQDRVSRAERGRIADMPLRRLRAIANALDAELVLTIRWRAGDLDRLLDEGHSTLVGRVTLWLARLGWEVRPEVTFSIYGERGSIDLLAWHEPTRTLLVIEIKTELVSVEETLRRHDVKVRLGPAIARERFGWRPAFVARLLVLPDDSTSRRRVDRHEPVLRRAYPLRSTELRRWLRSPRGGASGLAFLSPTRATRGRGPRLARKRIRRRAPSVIRRSSPSSLFP